MKEGENFVAAVVVIFIQVTDDIYTHHTHNTIVMALWSPKCLGANKGTSPTVDGHTVLGFQYLRTTQIKPPSCLSFLCPNGHRAGQKPSHRGCHLPSYSQEHLAVPKRNRSMGNLTCMFKTVFILLGNLTFAMAIDSTTNCSPGDLFQR